MSHKLCVRWDDFKEDLNSTFQRLRADKEFTDVTLACEDGQQMEAHKVILAASSPLFEKILQRSKHSHPLIYLKGFQSKDFLSILDFLYNAQCVVCKVRCHCIYSFMAQVLDTVTYFVSQVLDTAS